MPASRTDWCHRGKIDQFRLPLSPFLKLTNNSGFKHKKLIGFLIVALSPGEFCRNGEILVQMFPWGRFSHMVESQCMWTRLFVARQGEIEDNSKGSLSKINEIGPKM